MVTVTTGKSNMNFTIKNTPIGNNRCFIIAEIASSHGGAAGLLRKIFQDSIETGADAVKVQVFKAAKLCSHHNPDYETLKKIEISPEKWKEILPYAASSGTIVFAEVFDEESLELAAPFVDGLSVHATDLSNLGLLKLVAEKKKPVILNVGGSTLDEIRLAVDTVEQVGNKEVLLIYGLQNFPTRIEEINLNRIEKLQQEFPHPVGYHDHTESTHPCALTISLVALAKGARIIEKHITDDRSKKGFDYISSLHKDEFKKQVKMIREMESALGSPEIELSESDSVYRERFKKKIVAKEELKAGTIVRPEHLAFKRAPGGLLPSRLDQVINKKLLKDRQEDQTIEEQDLE